MFTEDRDHYIVYRAYDSPTIFFDSFLNLRTYKISYYVPNVFYLSTILTVSF